MIKLFIIFFFTLKILAQENIICIEKYSNLKDINILNKDSYLFLKTTQDTLYIDKKINTRVIKKEIIDRGLKKVTLILHSNKHFNSNKIERNSSSLKLDSLDVMTSINKKTIDTSVTLKKVNNKTIILNYKDDYEKMTELLSKPNMYIQPSIQRREFSKPSDLYSLHYPFEFNYEYDKYTIKKGNIKYSILDYKSISPPKFCHEFIETKKLINSEYDYHPVLNETTYINFKREDKYITNKILAILKQKYKFKSSFQKGSIKRVFSKEIVLLYHKGLSDVAYFIKTEMKKLKVPIKIFEKHPKNNYKIFPKSADILLDITYDEIPQDNQYYIIKREQLYHFKYKAK